MGKKFRDRKGILLETICKNIISVGTFLILFTPLVITARCFFPFVGPKSLYFMGLVEIVFFAWLILVFVSPKYRPKINLLLAVLLFYLFISILASIFGVDPFYSFWSKFERMTGILMMLHLLAFFLVISTFFEESDWKKIFAISLFAGVIISFIALTSKNPTMRGGATIGNDSFLGTYLLFNLFFALYLILKSREGLRTYSAICFAIIFFTLFSSDAQAAKLSFSGGLVLLLFLWLAFSQKKILKLIGISLLASSVIFSIYFLFFAFQSESFVHKAIIDRLFGETFGGRFIVWQKAWESFSQKPLLGWGLENFEFSFTKNYHPCMGAPPCGGDIWYDRAHNILFDILVSTGALGFLSYLGIFISVFYILWRNYFQKKFDFFISGIFTVLLISYFIQNLTVFDMVSSYMAFFLILGFIANLSKKEIIPPSEAHFPNIFIILIISILFIFSFFEFIIQPFRADTYTIKAVQAKDIEARMSFYEKTLTVSPVGRYQIREFFAEGTMEFALSEAAQQVPLEKIKKEFDFVSKELEKSTKESPLNFRAYLKLGQVYNTYVRFDPEKLPLAQEILEKAISLSPTNQQAYWALAQTKIYQGKFNEALSLAEKAIELEPKMEKSHLIIVQIAKIIGDVELVEKKIQEAIKINPGWEKDLRGI